MKNKNLKLFYLHDVLFQFSNSLLIVVLPIFIYQLYGSIAAIFAFSLTWNVVHGLFFIPIFNLAMRLKEPKYFMAIGVVFYVLGLYFYGKTTPEAAGFIVPGTLFFSLYIAFYWMLRHWFFSVNSDHKQMGKQVSFMGIIAIVVSFIGPIVGGWLSVTFDFNAAFLVGAGAGFLSLFPILFFHAPHHPEHFSLKEIGKIIKRPELKSQRLAFFTEGFANNMIEWPWILVFFIFIGDILDLSYLVGVTTLITAILTWMTGKWFDARSRRRLLDRVTHAKLLTTLLYGSIFFFPQVAFIYLVQTANGFVTTMHETVTNSYLYAFSNKHHPIYFNLNREIFLVISRILSSIALMFLFLFVPESYLWLVIVAGAFVLLGWKSLKNTDHLLH